MEEEEEEVCCLETLQKELQEFAFLSRMATKSLVTRLIEETVHDIHENKYIQETQREFCLKAIRELPYLTISDEDRRTLEGESSFSAFVPDRVEETWKVQEVEDDDAAESEGEAEELDS